MRSRLPQGFTVGIFVVALGLCDRGARAEGDGLRVGDGRVHPFVELHGRYDSLAQREVRAGGQIRDGDDFILHLRPGLRLESPSPGFAIAFSGFLDGQFYIKNRTPRLNGEVDLDLGINREGAVGLNLGAFGTRSDRSTVPAAPTGTTSLYADLRGGLPIRPGGGALIFEPTYNFAIEQFECLPSLTPNPCNFNFQNHTLGLKGTWKFLPKTAIVLDGQYLLRSYAGGIGTPTHGFRAQGGLQGLLSLHVATVLKVGWGYDVGTGSFSSLVAHAEFAYIPAETAKIAVGYVRTWQPVGGLATTISYSDDRPYLEVRALLGGALSLRAYGAVDFITYLPKAAAAGQPAATPTRFDTTGRVDVGLEYEVKRWFFAGGGYVFSARAPTGTGQTVTATDPYTRHEPYLRLKFEY